MAKVLKGQDTEGEEEGRIEGRLRKARVEEKEGLAARAQCAPGTSTYVMVWSLQNDPARELSSPPEHRRGNRPHQPHMATRLDDSNMRMGSAET